MDAVLSVSEIFGPTVQGEGRSQGRAVVFLRLGLCNLDCSWCDTPYTWDWTGKNGVAYDKETQLRKWSLAQVEMQLRSMMGADCTRLVISGGEPMLHQRRLVQLIERLGNDGIAVEIETNGTVMPNESMIDLCTSGVLSWNCSPKLSNSGIDYATRIDNEVLSVLANLATDFKFVIASDDDVHEVDALYADVLNFAVEPERMYLMPEGTETNTILGRLPWVMERAALRGWSVSPRLHVLAYGNKRGV